MTTGQRRPDAAGVARAAAKIAAVLPATPLLPLELPGGTLWCKAECLQPIGSFKLRGAWHRLTDLSEEERCRGVVAFSSGNHAQGIAWAARRLDIPALIVMPADAPRAKVDATRALGAEIVTYDRMRESREEIAGGIARARGATLVPSFADPWVIEGQGSAGVEMAHQMDALAGGSPRRILVCCGGGGLTAGIALACPDAEVITVEPEGWDDVARSLQAGTIQSVGPNPPSTACDAIQTLRTEPIVFDLLRARGVVGVRVSEADVERAMRHAFMHLQLVIEPGGAVALAAILAGRVSLEERTAVILSGGNVDPDRYAAVISREGAVT